MNYKDMLQGIRNRKTQGTIRGIVEQDPQNDRLIAECVIFEKVGNSKEALKEIFNKHGFDQSRAGLINESASIVDSPPELTTESLSELASILACAKEADSEDYRLLSNSICLVIGTINKLKETYGTLAEQRLVEVKTNIEDSPIL